MFLFLPIPSSRKKCLLVVVAFMEPRREIAEEKIHRRWEKSEKAGGSEGGERERKDEGRGRANVIHCNDLPIGTIIMERGKKNASAERTWALEYSKASPTAERHEKARDFPRTSLMCRAYSGQDYDFIQSLLDSPAIIRHLLSFLSRKCSYACHTSGTTSGWNRLDPSASLVLVFVVYAEPARARARENMFPEGSRARCGCTSFHSRCLRHTFTKLNWFSRMTHVQIYTPVRTIGVFNGKCWSSRFAYTRCLIIRNIIEKWTIFLLSFKQLQRKFVAPEAF